MKKYFDIITTDTGSRTIWDIYEISNSDKSVGYVYLHDNYVNGEYTGVTIGYYDYINDEGKKTKTLKEAFSHWGITNWDKPLY